MTLPPDDSFPLFDSLHALAQQTRGQKTEFLLPLSLGAAVPLWVHGIYERGGPTSEDWLRLRQFGYRLATHGDILLFGSSRTGETAEIFNQLAEALALLSFLPAGVSFGHMHFDAEQILSGLLGRERAQRYMAQVRQQRA